MDSTKRVIILTDLKSPMISQAIFILKDGVEDEFHAVAEAERIVEKYMARSCFYGRKRSVLPVIFAALTAIGLILTLISLNF